MLVGGVLVCAGQGCTVELTNVTLSETTLVVTAGATVALNRCQLTCNHSESRGICLIASGAHTTVKVRECWAAGGLVGAAVHTGACLEAKRSIFTGAEIVGIEAKGTGARLSMTENCRVEDMGRVYRGVNASVKGFWCRAIYAHAAASVAIRGVTVHSAEWGIHVRGASFHAQDCSISNCVHVCIRASRGSQCVVSRSVLDQSKKEGLWASHQGTRVELTACSLLKNRSCGCRVDEEADVRAKQCLTGGNGTGFLTQSRGQLQLADTGLKGDTTTGCRVQGAGSRMTAESVVCWDCKGVGYSVAQGATMLLQACSAVRCGCNGVQANDHGSGLIMYGGQLDGNTPCGVVVLQGAEGQLNGVMSRGSKRAGFGSTGSSSKLWLQRCVGEDMVGCEEDAGGRIAISRGCSFKNSIKVATLVGNSEHLPSSEVGSGKEKRGLRGWLSGKRT